MNKSKMYVVNWVQTSKPTIADASIDTQRPTIQSPYKEDEQMITSPFQVDEKMDGLGEHVLSEEFYPSGTNDSTSQGIEWQSKAQDSRLQDSRIQDSKF